MNTLDFENAFKHGLEKCNQFFDTFCPIPYQITNIRTYYPIDLLLDIYCEKKAFYTISPNRLFENVESTSGPSKSTLNKFYNFFKNDLKNFSSIPHIPGREDVPELYGYASNFLHKSITEHKNKLFTYNDIILGIIIGNWKYMPFNPRYIASTDRFGDKPIPYDKFCTFLKLNSTDLKNLSDDFDRLIYTYLTDRFFNINLYLSYIDFLAERGLYHDYERRLHPITIVYFGYLIPALKSLPSWYLKYLFWNEYVQNYQKIFMNKNVESSFDEMCLLLEKTVTDIYNFSLVYHPMYKLLLKNHLYSELNISEEDTLFNCIKNILSLDAKNNVHLYQSLSIELNENIDFYLLTTLTKEFYSKYQFSFHPEYPQADFINNPDRINALYDEVNIIVHNLMLQIRQK